MYRIADGKEVPLQKWDDYLKTKKPPKKPEPVKKESSDEFNARLAMENVTNKVKISKMTEENERFRKKIEQDKVHIQKLRNKIDRLQNDFDELKQRYDKVLETADLIG
jgi:molecular chaperone GrpE (heat shock protein)